MDNFESTRQAMQQLVLNANPITQAGFNKILEDHETFLLHGGAGGTWDTFYIKNLIFGVYLKPKPNQGTQAKLGFRNLLEVHLTNITLPYADCAAILCENKDWSGADLEGSLFIDSILNNCSFENADLYGADFSRAALKNCNFQGASLIKTDFENCDLSGANFTGAQIDSTTHFKNANLEGAIME